MTSGERGRESSLQGLSDHGGPFGPLGLLVASDVLLAAMPMWPGAAESNRSLEAVLRTARAQRCQQGECTSTDT